MSALQGFVAQFDHDDTARHDENMESGKTQILVHKLKDCCKGNFQNPLWVLRVAVLCSGIESSLQCSDTVLKDRADWVVDELLHSLAHVLGIFGAIREESLLREKVLRSSVGILSRIEPYVPAAVSIESLGEALVGLLANSTIPFDVHSDSVLLITRLLRYDCNFIDEGTNAERVASRVSDLVAYERGQEAPILNAVLSLAQIESVRKHFIRRRKMIRALDEPLHHADHAIRQTTLGIFSSMLKEIGTPGIGVASNVEIIAVSLLRQMLRESQVVLQVGMAQLLAHVLDHETLSTRRTQDVLKALFVVAAQSSSTLARREAAFGYMRGVAKAGGSPEHWDNVVDFVGSEHPTVRERALSLLSVWTLWNLECIDHLLETDMLQDFAMIMMHGSVTDTALVLQIASHAAAANAEILCEDEVFLDALVALVKNGPAHSAHVFHGGLGLLSQLLADNDNLPCFAKHEDLMIRLVTLANRATDKDLKDQIISCIIRLSEASS